MKIIIPCAGKSSRFPNMRPKWMLNVPNGNLMVRECIKGLDIKYDDIIITILKKHEEEYNIIKGIKDNFKQTIEVCILENETKDQSETVYQTIKKLNINEPIYIKDSDNYFELNNIESNYNYVTVENLNNFTQINPKNKSYIIVNKNNTIDEIHEKQVVSNMFSIGGYYFKSSQLFCTAYEQLRKVVTDREIYISDIIKYLILQGEVFFYRNGKNYKDWGTIDEWNKYKQGFKTYFIDIDGVIFKNGSQYFSPKWGETEALINNVQAIKKLKANGNQIILVTSRTEEYRDITEINLKEVGIDYDNLIMGCLHSQRVIINDFSSSNTFPTAISINTIRDNDNLEKYIL